MRETQSEEHLLVFILLVTVAELLLSDKLIQTLHIRFQALEKKKKKDTANLNKYREMRAKKTTDTKRTEQMTMQVKSTSKPTIGSLKSLYLID